MSDGIHIPVMLREVVTALQPRDGATYVDGTFGGGGYTRAVLDEANCTVIGIDRDRTVIDRAQFIVKAYDGRLHLHHGRFSDMDAAIDAVLGGSDALVDGIMLDLGVSSFQLDDAARGFSFMKDGPLDMRMGGKDDNLPSAADVINTLSEKELASILSAYGEERRAGAIARAIAAARQTEPITRTLQLAEIVQQVLGRPKRDEIHPATRTFQGLRIYVNKELGELGRALFAAERRLAPGGKLVVVSFHSLEDRIVKTFFQARTGRGARGSRHLPEPAEAARKPSFVQAVRGVVSPTEEEIEANPRSRSAKLRAAERTAAPAWPEDWEALGLKEDQRP